MTRSRRDDERHQLRRIDCIYRRKGKETQIVCATRKGKLLSTLGFLFLCHWTSKRDQWINKTVFLHLFYQWKWMKSFLLFPLIICRNSVRREEKKKHQTNEKKNLIESARNWNQYYERVNPSLNSLSVPKAKPTELPDRRFFPMINDQIFSLYIYHCRSIRDRTSYRCLVPCTGNDNQWCVEIQKRIIDQDRQMSINSQEICFDVIDASIVSIFFFNQFLVFLIHRISVRNENFIDFRQYRLVIDHRQMMNSIESFDD